MLSTLRWISVAATVLALSAGGSSYAASSHPASSHPASSHPASSHPASPAGTRPATGPSPTTGYASAGTWQLLALVNKHRHDLGLPVLVLDGRLAAIARRHTEQMAATGDLQHNDGLFTPASHASLGMRTFGENVGWNYSVTAQEAAFLNSPLHRANIETDAFRVAGFAVVRGADGRIWSTEDFGTPS